MNAMRMYGRISRSRGFSLSELLVVVSILALFLGLLLPALQSARRRAWRVQCGSNIRQIALANIAHSSGREGRFIAGAAEFLENLRRWHGERDSVQERFDSSRGPLAEYLGPSGVVRECPELVVDHSEAGADFEAGAGGYGYNNAFVGVDERRRDLRGALLADVGSPFATVMFGDAAFGQDYPRLRVIEYSFVEPVYQRGSDEGFELDPSMHFRHGGGAEVGAANTAWVDGHVSVEGFAFTRKNIYGVSEVEMRALSIGWFGPVSNQFFDLN